MRNSLDELYQRRIKGDIIKIKNGTSEPIELNVCKKLIELKKYNIGQYETLLSEYNKAVLNYNQKMKKFNYSPFLT